MRLQIWMLTGDKLETALCIARSLHLGGGAAWLAARACAGRRDAHRLLDTLRAAGGSTDLIIEGDSLEVRPPYYRPITGTGGAERSVLFKLCNSAQGVPAIVRRRVRGSAARLQRRGGGALLADAEGARGAAAAAPRARRGGRRRRGERRRHDPGGRHRSVYLTLRRRGLTVGC